MSTDHPLLAALVRAERIISEYEAPLAAPEAERRARPESPSADLKMIRDAIDDERLRQSEVHPLVRFRVVQLNREMSECECLNRNWWWRLPPGEYALYGALPPAAHLSGRMVRHVTRGTDYQILLDAELQTAEPVPEGTTLRVYVGKDGKGWARPVPEFEDGRFETIAPAPAAA